MLALGLPPLAANVTNTTGLVPTSVGAALASRLELEGQRSRLAYLAVPTVLGSGAGATLLLTTPTTAFEAMVPFLIAGSSLLLFGQPWIVARAGHRLLASDRRGSWVSAAGALALGSLGGGMAGARLSRRVPARPLRVGIALVGLAVAAWIAVA